MMFHARLAFGIAGAILFVSDFSARAQDIAVELIGEWELTREIDPIFDTEDVIAMLISEDSTSFSVKQGIFFGCKEGELGVLITWVGSADFDQGLDELAVRFDALSPQFETWSRSKTKNNMTVMRSLDPEGFMREAVNHKRLAVRMWKQEDGSWTGTFDLKGVRSVVTKVGLACNIPESAW